MKQMEKKSFIITALLLLFLALPAMSQIRTTVYDITEHPRTFEDEYIRVTGTVTQWIPQSSTTFAHYVLKDDDGASIRVRTSAGPPQTYSRINVWGIVIVEGGTPYIFEHKITVDNPKWTWEWALVGLLAVVIIGVILYFGMRKKESPAASQNQQGQQSRQRVQGQQGMQG